MLPTSDIKCCYNCKYWHKRKNYACQHNGPYGGGTIGTEECIFKKKENYGNKRSTKTKSGH